MDWLNRSRNGASADGGGLYKSYDELAAIDWEPVSVATVAPDASAMIVVTVVVFAEVLAFRILDTICIVAEEALTAGVLQYTPGDRVIQRCHRKQCRLRED